ncbi:MAG: hypothetical protein OXH50_14215, partial [Gemmatimonadetes bacterium]|nr:hypothetical protein [Gemmatimonadota bacterium]
MRSLLPVLTVVSAAALPLQAAPGLLPQTPHQEAVPPVQGLLGTKIGDIVWSGRYLWIATERGLARLDPTDSNGLKDSDWVTFTEAHGLGRGSVSALAASGDTVWAATLFDTTLGSSGQAGNGLSFSVNSGETWRHIPNETIFDPSRPSFADPEPTQVDNACYGLALDGSTVWAAFFAGSSVRSRDAGRTWERVLPDGADKIVYNVGDNDARKFRILADSLADSGDADEERVREARAAADSLDLQSYVHRTFSALAYDDTVWVGTAAGVARSFDGGTTWKQSRAAFDEFGERLAGSLSANWVVAIARQRLPGGGSAVWAGANLGPANRETAAINFSADNGESWQFSGPTFAWGFAFAGNAVWAASNDGLLRSGDAGLTWETVVVEDLQSRDHLRGTFVGVETAPNPEGGKILWVGAENGLALGAVADPDGEPVADIEWRILAFPLKTRALDSGDFIGEGGAADPDSTLTYAAPSPFAPSRDEHTRIVFGLENPAEVSISLYDFA